jgi:antitoxin MazE
MKTHLVRIGNSRGVRLAKPLLEEAGLVDAVEIRARAGAVVITPLVSPRAGWAAAAARLAGNRQSGLIDEPTPTQFDDDEWEWK